MEEGIVESSECQNCSKPIRLSSKFCRHCGAQQAIDDTRDVDRDVVIALGAFYLLEFTICALVTYNESFHGLKCLLIADGIMAGLAIFFSAYLANDILPIFRWPGFSIKKVLLYVSIAIVSSIIVQYLMKWLNYKLFATDRYYYYAFTDFKHPMLWMILITAVSPAIFEELGYRGFIMGGLLRLIDKRQAVFISSFVFALIHLSILSMAWLLPFALLLGYVRVKENTIWYGVLIHFTFNAVSCLFEYYQLHLY